MTCFRYLKRSRQDPCFWVLVFGLILLLFPRLSTCCWGKTAPKYGGMTSDYDLLVGDELILNCTLNSHFVEVGIQNDNQKYYVNSSHLIFRKGAKLSSSYVHIIDDLTAQLQIPAAKKEDSGLYYCELAIPQLPGERLVCNSKVSVGYPPNPVSNFKCISWYYEYLTCTWDFEDSGIQTKYTLYKHHFFSSYFDSLSLQQCPVAESNNTFCQWRDDTDPPFDKREKTYTFVLKGNNSLGLYNETFTAKHYEILVPSYPRSFTVEGVDKRSISLSWSAPMSMEGMHGKPPLEYELWVEEAIQQEMLTEKKVIKVGIDIFSYNVSDLIPYVSYKFSLRCQSKFALSSDMWSPLISVQGKTLSDVPVVIPETIPEAFELHHYDGYRTVTLYWKPVPRRHFNGEDFKYYIDYFANETLSDNMVSEVKSLNVTTLSATFHHLQEDSAYVFRIFSMNEQGLSNTYSSIILNQQSDIPELPQDITAISHDPGHYELSWKPPKVSDRTSFVQYIVFWCSSLKPWLSRCEGPIQWLNTTLKEAKVTLNLSDSSTNFQFAVVARTAVASSGMQWATCIVPFKAALGKITYVIVEPNDSTSLNVMWRLECVAQKAVVKKFEIVYCKTDEMKQCQERKSSIDVEEPEAESYMLRNLYPFSNYSVIVRAYNLAGYPSEDSDPKFRQTMQGAPEDPPWNVQAVATPNASLHATWLPPLHPNGIITHYQLMFDRRLQTVKVNDSKAVYEADITGLSHYVNYSIVIKACVHHHCSPMSAPISVRTAVGEPGFMDPPRVDAINSTFINVSWNKPFVSNGPIDLYEVRWKVVKNWTSFDQEVNYNYKEVKQGTTTVVEITCPSIEDGGIKYLFSIRAANIKDGKTLYGPMSDDAQARACHLSQGLEMIIGAAIGGTLALAFVMLLIYKLIKWMSDKIHQVKNITVRLPKGLDGLETNPLNNYENFKNGLLNQTLNTAGLGRLSYVIDEGDGKNRHGSGSSQYSYSSTDELLYKNGRCTKYSRKPSGESSGCSSMSSNITKIHPSSESSAESDFMTPPSPDIVFADQSASKAALPVVVEAQDTVDDAVKDLTCLEASEDESKSWDVSYESMSKTDQPYSKFGMTNHSNSMPPWWVNSLAFYSLNLSNSEPSVPDAKETVEVCMPYSKVGLAKSSGDIIGINGNNPDLGYSKFGIVPKFSGLEFQPFMNIAVSKPDLPGDKIAQETAIHPKKIDHYKNTGIDDCLYGDKMHGKLIGEQRCLSMPSHMMISSSPSGSDDGYIKFRRTDRHMLPVKPGYVPFKEMSILGKKIAPEYPLLDFPVLRTKDSIYEIASSDGEYQPTEFHMPESAISTGSSLPLDATDADYQNTETGVTSNIPTRVQSHSLMSGACVDNNGKETSESPRETIQDPCVGIMCKNDDIETHFPETSASTLPTSLFEIQRALPGNVSDKPIIDRENCSSGYNAASPEEHSSYSEKPQALTASPIATQLSSSSFQHQSSQECPVAPSSPSSKTVSKNGYVPLSSLSGDVNEVIPCVPNVQTPLSADRDNSEKCNLLSSEHVNFHLPEDFPDNGAYKIPSTVRTNGVCSPQYNMYPILDNISAYDFALPCNRDIANFGRTSPTSNKKSNVFSPSCLVNFGHPMDSEICEV